MYCLVMLKKIILNDETLLGIRLTGQLLLDGIHMYGLTTELFFLLISDILHWPGSIHLHPAWCDIIPQ